jgi:hypothetical protein
MRSRRFASLLRCCLILVAPALSALSGCGGNGAPDSPNQDEAKQTLERVLTAWQKGETVDALAKASPSIKVSEPNWERGDKLTTFELTGPGQPKGGQRAFRVKLSLTGAQGKQTNETAEYRVITHPYETVTRLIFD